LASLGSPVGFIGKVADDRLGRSFGEGIHGLGVVFKGPAGSGRPASTDPSAASVIGTGRSLILVTPDADRTMCTSLGVSADLTSDDVDPALIGRAKVTYLEGYLFDRPAAKDAFRYAIKVAHDAGRKVAMSLSDSFCVQRHQVDFLDLVDGPLDILFANSDEVRALAGTEDLDAAIDRVRRAGLTVTITLGAEGALVFEGADPVERVSAWPPPAILDTTGAGDLYAAGFLHGLTAGLPLVQCARLGSVAASECISHVGATPETNLAALVDQALR
jgi:sugar/nucleoside kinase (ribokinase family)